MWGWLAHPHASVEQLAQSAQRVGVDVSPQAIDQRFTMATADLLREVLVRSVRLVLAGDPLAIPILRRFTGVYLQDSTTIVLPDALADVWRGCGGSTTTNTTAALKCGVQIDLLHTCLTGFDLADGRAADQGLPIQHAVMPAGSLRLADLGFFDLQVFAQQQRSGSFWLSKVPVGVTVQHAGGFLIGFFGREATDRPRCDHTGSLLRFIQNLPVGQPWEGWVVLGKAHPLRGRMLVQPVPQDVADQRRRRIRKEAREKGRPPSRAALLLAAWTILVTNLPAHRVTMAEAMVLIKVRWQIELLFKHWKSHGQIDTWRTQKPARILCEVYGKLLAMVVQHWLVAVSGASYPDRSLVKIAQAVRDQVSVLMDALPCLLYTSRCV